MMMRRNLLMLLVTLTASTLHAQDTLWMHAADPFGTHVAIDMRHVDSIAFNRMYMRFHADDGTSSRRTYAQKYDYYTFRHPGLSIYKPADLYRMDFDEASSQWCWQRSRQSEHFVVFWDSGFGDDPAVGKGAARFDPDALLRDAEYFFQMYTDSLGFAPINVSTTVNTYKIEIYVNSKSTWLATGSGYDDKIGALWCNYSAVNAHSTLAHEIGHSFQYIVSCDLGTSHGWRWGFGTGASGGCAWWENCAQWQAFRCYPREKFSSWFSFDYFHQNLFHEDGRYYCHFIQDYWVQLHGIDFIGRLWRASARPEDPVETYKRLTGADQKQFNDEIYDYAARSATWDIDAIRDYGRTKMNHTTKMNLTDAATRQWQVDASQCPQNYGYNIIPLTPRPEGTVVKARFKGLAGADGYRSVNIAKAGWRYGFVALAADGTRTYGPMQSDTEGTAEMTLPARTERLWLVVTGAPTAHWRHAWDDNETNDEQWPYQVQFDETDLSGYFMPTEGEVRDTVMYATAYITYRENATMSTTVELNTSALSQAFKLAPNDIKGVTNSAVDTLCTFAEEPDGRRIIGTRNNLYCFLADGTTTDYADTSTDITVYGTYMSFFGGYYIIANGSNPDVKPGASFPMRIGIRYKPEGSDEEYFATCIITVNIVE